MDDINKLFGDESILVIRREGARLALATATQCTQKIAITIVCQDYMLTSADEYSIIVFAGTPDRTFLDRNAYFLSTPRLRVYSVTDAGLTLIPLGRLFP